MVEFVETPYDREWHIHRTVRHPDPKFADEWFAIYNTETQEYRLDDDGNVKRYWHKFRDSVGYDMTDDDTYLREIGKAYYKYGPYVAK